MGTASRHSNFPRLHLLQSDLPIPGRNYEAWYTPEIPRSEGPWKLQGLPGLILKASDSRQHYTFVCTGIEKAGKEEAILFIGSEHERFAADPIGYLKETSPGMQIIVKGEDGQPMHPKNTPYNPIEKE